MTLPASDVADLLETGGHGTIGTDLFTGPVRPSKRGGVPASAIFVIPTSGQAPSLHNAGKGELRYPSIQIRIRSLPEEYDPGYTVAKAVYETVHDAFLAGYVSCLAEQSEPLYIGADEQGCHEWSVNLTLIVKERDA